MSLIIPANAEIQERPSPAPAFAGMTDGAE